MKKNKPLLSSYWLCQVAGWSGFVIIYTVMYYSLNMKLRYPYYFDQLFLEAFVGFGITHIMRSVIRYFRLLHKNVNRQAVSLFIMTVVFTGLYSSIDIFFEKFFAIQDPSTRDTAFTEIFIRTSFLVFIFLTIWNLIYFAYHHIARSRNEHLDKIRLETLVKELQLKTIKAHINPHFIFNALNSIRSLVDENPERARTAITELSHILRSSMASDKIETVSLEKELAIVKNYLALEQIRFEERLQVHLQIDEDTLAQPVPYMMLQTLVENAVKHGISKTMEGGHICISSDFVNDHHELVIRNTGHLNGSAGSEGFGLSSTRNRLSLLYGSQAGFQIKDVGDKEVEAKLILPVVV